MPAVPADVTPAYLAIDWGTTNRRIYVIANDGTMLDTIRDDRGVLAMAAGEYRSEIAAIRDRLGDLPIIAEDLGEISKDVSDLRLKYGLPGMKILQFSFSSTPNDPFLPSNYEPNFVAYTGTHDNETTLGWFSVERVWLEGSLTASLG